MRNRFVAQEQGKLTRSDQARSCPDCRNSVRSYFAAELRGSGEFMLPSRSRARLAASAFLTGLLAYWLGVEGAAPLDRVARVRSAVDRVSR